MATPLPVVPSPLTVSSPSITSSFSTVFVFQSTVTRPDPRGTPEISTIWADSRRIVISLPLDWPTTVPLLQRVSTYLLDPAGHTTRTLGYPDRPTTTAPPFEISTRTRGEPFIPPPPSAEDFPLGTSDGASSATPTPTAGPHPPTASSAGSSTTRRTIAASVAGGVAVVVVIGLIFFFRRWYQRRRAGKSPATISYMTEGTASKRPAAPGSAGVQNVGHSTTLPSPSRLQSPDRDAKRRVPSREDLTTAEAGAEAGPERPAPRIYSPQANRAPLRTWRGFPGLPADVEYDYARMQQGPLSVTEDYSTNAGEGSVDGYWLETASMRDERLYRMQREGHTPPPPSSTPQEGPSRSVAGDYAKDGHLAAIQEDRVAGLSLVGRDPAAMHDREETGTVHDALRPAEEGDEPGPPPEGPPPNSSLDPEISPNPDTSPNPNSSNARDSSGLNSSGLAGSNEPLL
ncbi:MAG: hypothetical protein M1826_004644 [Phylliscum demangeonii]|nr:MAG: hypothetical protein M1826_004644 [Phylliscum demangeonii]